MLTVVLGVHRQPGPFPDGAGDADDRGARGQDGGAGLIGTPLRWVSGLRPAGDRRVWSGHGRAHIEVRELQHPGSELLARRIEAALCEVDGVDWAAVNPVLRRVVVAFDDQRTELDRLTDVVEREEAAAPDLYPASCAAGPEHPADLEPLYRHLLAVAADAAGLGLSTVARIAGRGPLTAELALAVAFVDSTPRLRALLEDRFGEAAVDLALALANAGGQGLAQGPLGLLLDAIYRLVLIADVTARREAWAAREPELCGRDRATRVDPVEARPRPGPPPRGRVDRYSDDAALAAAVAALSTLGVTRNWSKALTALACGTPKAARLTRETFTATLGRTLWRRGVVPLNQTALKLLDRVDTVVLDGAVLVTGRVTIGALARMPDAHQSDSDLRVRAADLLDSTDPRAVRRKGGWALGPLSSGATRAPGVGSAAAQVRRPGGVLLGLLDQQRLVAVLSVEPELDGFVPALAASAGAAGRLLVAGRSGGLAARIGAEASLPAGSRLADAVRKEQAAGHVVALVTHRGNAALRAADCGIGVLQEATEPPWGADLLCGPGLAPVCRVLDAATAARTVSRRAALVALYGSVVAALLALTGPQRGATRRALTGVNGAAAAGMALGVGSAVALSRNPEPIPADGTEWHALAPDAALGRVGSSPHGITEAEARRRRRFRTDQPIEDPGLGRASFDELRNPLTPVLATGVGLSALTGAATDAVLVGSVMVANALLGGGQRVGVSRALKRLQDTASVRARVVRDGAWADIPAVDLVVGDVIELQAGNTVPADCRVLTSAGLEIDQASLTGESQLAAKTATPTAAGSVADRSSMLYEGTVVAAGQATAVVIAVGAQTESARAASTGSHKQPVTGVHARLNRLTKATVPAALGAGAALMGVDLLRGRPPRESLSTGVGLAVAAVPEGLPLVATVAQLAAAQRLSRRGALVRNPSTVEALGRVDVLCFDKTGTLTAGRLAVTLVSDGVRDDPVRHLSGPARMVLIAALRASPEPETRMAHPTDAAVVDAARAAEVRTDARLVADVPFESARGYHAALVARGDGHLLCVKGAPEVVLPLCETSNRDGRMLRLQARQRRGLEARVEALARRGFRVLAVAERPASSRADLTEERVTGLSFLGLIALADPVRQQAKKAVTDLRRAGVDIVMITGDHPTTAESVAAELDLLGDGSLLTGPELDRLTDHELAGKIGSVSVFARVSPAQKVRIVAALQKSGRTVAMTGDGSNDAAAIRLADVGAALGERCTDAARQAADLVVTDGRIETIIDAIIEGRSMWISVRDAVSVLVGGNLGEIAYSLGTGLLSRHGSALNARQLLLVNLMTDLIPSMALSVRPPEHHDPQALLTEGPESSLAGALTQDVAVRATVTGASAGAAWAVARGTGTRARADTVGLLALVGTQLGQTALAGWRSPLVLAGSVASAGALSAVVQTPGLSHFFGCRPLGPLGWATALTASGLGTLTSSMLPRFLDERGHPVSASPSRDAKVPTRRTVPTTSRHAAPSGSPGPAATDNSGGLKDGNDREPPNEARHVDGANRVGSHAGPRRGAAGYRAEHSHHR